ncbi:hypothetical protein K0U27_08325 [archaeon]|nr:hypothetical protein [archaeon]
MNSVKRLIISIIIGSTTEIIIFVWFYHNFDANTMTIESQLKALPPVRSIFDFLAPPRLEALFGWFLVWSVVPFIVLMVSLPGKYKLLSFIMFIPWSYFDMFATAWMFFIFDRLELYQKVLSSGFPIHGVSATLEEKIIVFLLRFPFAVLLLSLVSLISKRN